MSPPRRLRIAKGLALPLDSATKTFAVLAQRRKGKTYTASVLAEEMAKAGQPWAALDPTGAWWGLRSSADGKRAGLPVLVVGGQHGQLPLERGAGKLLADLVVDEPGHYVFDLSLFESKAAEREFATAFAERLYRRKGKSSDPLHLFVDEADMVVPQRSPAGDQRMLGAFEAIVRRGGIRGIGTTLISQRAAVVNKNVLEQIDVLIALRTVGPNDQKAIKAYIDAAGATEKREELMGSLASLELGEAWVWEPGADQPLFERVKIRERETFNSSATPRAGAKRIEPRKLADVDLAAIEEKIADTIERAKSEDPKLLRKQIKELERKVRVLERQLAERPAEPVEVEKVVEVPALSKEDRELLEGAVNSLKSELGYVNATLEPVVAALAQVGAAGRRPKPAAKVRSSEAFPPAAPRARLARSNGRASDASEVNLKAGARRMLAELAAFHPGTVTKAQLATLAKMKVTGGTFQTYYSTLRRHGLLDESDGEIAITEAGFAALGLEEPPAPRTPEEMLEMWRDKLKRGAREILDALVSQHPSSVDREELAEVVGMTASGGTFQTYISTLRRNGLAEVDGSEIRASETLFMGVI